MSRMSFTINRALAALGLGVVAALTLTGPAAAAPGQVTYQPVAGDVFPCLDGTSYTAQSGSIRMTFHDSLDAQGGEHVTGTITPVNVILVGSDGRPYTIHGADWFGGNFSAAGEFTDTEHFNITPLGGGAPVANVSVTEHLTINAQGVVTSEVSLNKGSCATPSS